MIVSTPSCQVLPELLDVPRTRKPAGQSDNRDALHCCRDSELLTIVSFAPASALFAAHWPPALATVRSRLHRFVRSQSRPPATGSSDTETDRAPIATCSWLLATCVCLHHQQRVAAEIEEVVVQPDLRHAQHFAPDAGNHPFDAGRRATAGRMRPLRISAAVPRGAPASPPARFLEKEEVIAGKHPQLEFSGGLDASTASDVPAALCRRARRHNGDADTRAAARRDRHRSRTSPNLRAASAAAPRRARVIQQLSRDALEAPQIVKQLRLPAACGRADRDRESEARGRRKRSTSPVPAGALDEVAAPARRRQRPPCCARKTRTAGEAWPSASLSMGTSADIRVSGGSSQRPSRPAAGSDTPRSPAPTRSSRTGISRRRRPHRESRIGEWRRSVPRAW